MKPNYYSIHHKPPKRIGKKAKQSASKQIAARVANTAAMGAMQLSIIQQYIGTLSKKDAMFKSVVNTATAIQGIMKQYHQLNYKLTGRYGRKKR